MSHQLDYNPFHNIPRRKLDEYIEDLREQITDPQKLIKVTEAFTRYYNANIPVDYWDRGMHKFEGNNVLKQKYDEIVKDIKQSYRKGIKVCFAGFHGCGKTYTASCILKRVVETNKYSSLYVNLTDIINVLASRTEENKSQARTVLLDIDFLVIDEFDPRFIGSENAADLFGRTIEPIIRTRIQNRLPMFICTNSPNIGGGFSGALEQSISSLMKVIPTCVVIGGEDYRGKNG